MSTIYVMCGLPGSGKTTEAKRLEREIGASRVSFDEEIGRYFSRFHKLGGFDTDILDTIRSLLDDGKDVICDGMNLSKSERGCILENACAARRICVYMEHPNETSIPRQLAAYLEPPEEGENFDEIIRRRREE